MPEAWVARMRWRRRGAWLWPMFAVLSVVDAVVAHALPPGGDSQSFSGALAVALFANVIVVLLCSRPFGALLRRRRPDLPAIIARDYGGRIAVSAVTLIVVLAGLLHHQTIVNDHRAMEDAITRAQAWIGARAPDEFRRNLEVVSTFTIQSGQIYRTCVPSDRSARTYCVIVNVTMPFADSVKFAGYEPNSVFSEGAN